MTGNTQPEALDPADLSALTEREAAYDMIDRFLYNNLGSDEDYAEYSKALDAVLGASLAALAVSPTPLVGQPQAASAGGEPVAYAVFADATHAVRTQQPAPATQQEAPADELEEVLRERDDAEDFINELLDEVLGVDRPEWSSAYNRYDAMNDVRERITALHKPAADKAWGRFGSATAEPKPSPAAQGDALSDAVRVPLNSLHADAAYLIGRLRDGSMPYARVIEIIRERIDAASPMAQAAPAAGAVAGSDDLSGTLRRLDSKELAAWVDRGMALSENLAMYVQADCTLRESQARDMLRAHLFSAQPAPAAPTSPAQAADSQPAPDNEAILSAARNWGDVQQYNRTDGKGTEHRIVFSMPKRAAHFARELLAARKQGANHD